MYLKMNICPACAPHSVAAANAAATCVCVCVCVRVTVFSPDDRNLPSTSHPMRWICRATIQLLSKTLWLRPIEFPVPQLPEESINPTLHGRPDKIVEVAFKHLEWFNDGARMISSSIYSFTFQMMTKAHLEMKLSFSRHLGNLIRRDIKLSSRTFEAFEQFSTLNTVYSRRTNKTTRKDDQTKERAMRSSEIIWPDESRWPAGLAPRSERPWPAPCRRPGPAPASGSQDAAAVRNSAAGSARASR